MGKLVADLVDKHNTILMANHGAVAYGDDLWQAWDRLETLEHTAKIAERLIAAPSRGPASCIVIGSRSPMVAVAYSHSSVRPVSVVSLPNSPSAASTSVITASASPTTGSAMASATGTSAQKTLGHE